MTVEKQQKFLKVIQTERVRYKEQMLISMFTGMRMGEVNALTPKDINFKFNFINIDKTVSKGRKGSAFVNDSAKTEKGNRTVPINELVKPVVEEVLVNYEPTEDGMLFHTTVGTLVTTNQVNMEFKRLLERFDIRDEGLKGELSLHSLRHTYATRCIEGGMPPKILQNLLGHKDISVTLDTYSDVFENFQTENVAKIDEYMKALGMGA